MGQLSTEDRAVAIWRRYAYPDWLRQHSLVVGRIASVIARAHLIAGRTLDEEAVIFGGYLHDIGRSPLLAGDAREHNELSSLVASAEGLGSISEVVRRHPVYAAVDPARVPRTLEEKIVNVADRRGEMAVVSLEQRIDGIASRWKTDAATRDAWLAASRRLEAEVFEGLPFGPADLARIVT